MKIFSNVITKTYSIILWYVRKIKAYIVHWIRKNILLSQCKSVAQNISNNKQTKKHFHLVMIHWIFGMAIYLYILCNYIHGSAYLEGGYTTSNLDCSDDQSPHLGKQGALKIISYEYFLNQITAQKYFININSDCFYFQLWH